jgi:membrane-bound lytic murein transglycosylase D
MYLYEYHNEHGIKADRAVVQHFATDTIMIKKANVIQTSCRLTRCLFAIAITESVLQIEYHSFYNENHYLRLPTEIAAFVSNEDKMYAYVQHELDLKENPFRNSRVVKSDENSSETKQLQAQQNITK